MLPEAYRLTYEYEKGYWWYQARAEILEQIFAKKVSLKEPEILNLGCGTGLISQRFLKFGSLISLDAGADALGFCAQNHLDFLIQADAVSLPFQDRCFDACLCLDVIEHIQNHERVFAEIQRVLKPGGFLLITVPAFQWMWSQMDDFGHLRRYTRNQLLSLLKQAGLNPVLLSYYNFFLFPLALLQRFAESLSRKQKSLENIFPRLPGFLNQLFYLIFKSEKNWLLKFSFPFGLSIISLAVKSEKKDNERKNEIGD